MAELSTKISSPTNESRSALRKGGNPALRMIGLPQIRAKLPSRKWMVFLSITSAFTGALVYDRHHKKQAQRKWCHAVSHLANESLPTENLPRRVTVFLEAPPGDYLSSAREHFKEYVKPILVAAALEWDIVEGRREGDIRHKLAQQIRDERQRLEDSTGGKSSFSSFLSSDVTIRETGQVQESEERGGDLIIGRHTWKEYIRGLHEGWLGPLNAPWSNNTLNSDISESEKTVSAAKTSLTAGREEKIPGNGPSSVKPDAVTSEHTETHENIANPPETLSSELSIGNSTENSHDLTKTDNTTEKKGQPSGPTPAFITPSQYSAQNLPECIPSKFSPSVAIGFPHLLGFLNTPIRIWRFIHQRHIAEETGASVAAFILARDDELRIFRSQEAESTASSPGYGQTDKNTSPGMTFTDGEWQQLLEHEEKDWHKSAWQPNLDSEGQKERPWQENLTVDVRLAQRMRTVDPEVVSKYVQSAGHGSVEWPYLNDKGPAFKTIIETPSENLEMNGNTFPKETRGVNWKGGVDTNATVTWWERIRRKFYSHQKAVSMPWIQALETTTDENE